MFYVKSMYFMKFQNHFAKHLFLRFILVTRRNVSDLLNFRTTMKNEIFLCTTTKEYRPSNATTL